MRLGGRLQAAIEVLEDISKRHRPVADALKDWGLSHRFAGSADRAAIGNMVYDALRRRRSASAMLGAQTERAAVLGALFLEGAETPQSYSAAVRGDRFAPPDLSPDEQAAIGNHRFELLSGPIQADIPDWCMAEFDAAYGSGWVEEAAALATRPPLDLRANILKTTRDRLISALKQSNPVLTAIAHAGVRIAPVSGHGRHPNVQVEPAFQKGWFEVQDEGSQLAATLAAFGKPGQVLDFCAGAGGKTLALAALMENRGQIFAHDTDKQRLAPIFDRLKRSGARNVQILSDPAALEPLTGKMDLVLVDAPCTGSGTWRRRPDAKWRLTDRQLDARMTEQDAILAAAARYAKPGGYLVYVTCSVFPSENDERIASFLRETGGFSPVDHRPVWTSQFDGHEARAIIRYTGIALSPARTGTDGFFISLLQRHGG